MKKALSVGSVGAVAFLPLLAFAETLEDTVETIGGLIDLATPIIVAAALAYFFWNLVMYLGKKDDDKKKAVGGMIYSIIALFVMVSIWGIINILQDTFNVQSGGSIEPPKVDIR